MPLPSRLQDDAMSGALPVVYLHGFASSPRSSKATFFAERLRAAGTPFRCPDLNEPDFATLTITRMLGVVAGEFDALGDERIVLMGSSLGGALAILAAHRFAPRVDRLVLLAPAVMFGKPGHHLLPPERVAEWRAARALPFFHYAHGEDRLLKVEFYEDTQRYDPFTTPFSQPALVFQGLRDTSVDYRTVEQFARTRPNVTLSLLDDDHQLVASLPRMWDQMLPFLGLTD